MRMASWFPVAASVLLGGCASAPAPNPSGSVRLHVEVTRVRPPPDDADERRLGAEVGRGLAPPFADPAVAEYVQSVADRALARAQHERPRLRFRAVVFDAGPADAFALPDGAVYVSTGMLFAVGDESELAAVLAHEAAHAVHHATLQSHPLAAEARADADAARALAEAGYDPHALGRLLDRLHERGGAAWLASPTVRARVSAVDRAIAVERLGGDERGAERVAPLKQQLLATVRPSPSE